MVCRRSRRERDGWRVHRAIHRAERITRVGRAKRASADLRKEERTRVEGEGREETVEIKT